MGVILGTMMTWGEMEISLKEYKVAVSIIHIHVSMSMSVLSDGVARILLHLG